MIGPEGIDRTEAAGLVLGRMIGVLAAQTKRPVTVVALDGRESDAPATPATMPVPREPAPPPPREEPAAKKSSLFEEEAATNVEGVQEVPTSVTLQGSALAPAPEPAKPASLFRQVTPAPTPAPKPATTKPQGPTQSLAERFSSWRDRMRAAQPRAGD